MSVSVSVVEPSALANVVSAKVSKSTAKVGSKMLLGGSLMIAALQVHAADAAASKEAATESAADIQTEIDRLKQLLEKEQQKLASKTAADASGASAPNEPAQAADAADSDATTQLKTLVIHSRSRIESQHDKPQSVSVVTGTELEKLNAVKLGDITQRAANVSWNLGNSRTSSLSIRGIGKQAQTDAMDPSVGVVVDGVAYAYNPLSSFDFTDIAAVEVARGPQGTQGGKNANLGLLNIISNRPTFESEADASITFGENRTLLGRAAIGGAVIDKLLAWRGSFAVDKGDGAIKNAYNSDFSYQNMDNVSGRLQFLLTPSDNLNALVRIDYEPRHNEFYNG
ncbi:MAG: putative TonB-dependent receptor, partial [Nevskia sp.]|nr:putative TonB-dependent receptor [Nevskia sp.]